MGTDRRPDEPPIRVLLIDDDPDDHILTRELFAELPGGRFRLDHAPTEDAYAAGLEAVCRGEHDVYLVDYRLGARNGIELIQEARARCSPGPIIVLTGKGEYAIDREAMRAGAADYLEKAGLTAAQLERSIRYALQQARYAAELEREVRERTDALNRANEALREEDRRKNDFIAMLAHELRNPLAPIRNALEIMRLAADDPDAVARTRAMLERQVGQMVRLIDDLLDVSRITTGKLRVQLEPTPLREVVEAAVEISRPALDRAGVEFTLAQPDRPVTIRADRVRLAQVFSNLLNNAAKFTPEGGRVEFAVGREGNEVVARVRDTGVGIAPEVLPRVFDLFTQLDRTMSRSQGGLGIGLALVRRLVELHGGTVSVASDGPGRGAEFTVRLPV
jgi:signal transduction histidine kinase